MVVEKDASAIERFYDPEFAMFSNGVTQGYESFRLEHEKVYDTEIQYAVEVAEDAWVDAGDRVAARVWITTKRPDESETRIEVILIATFRDGRIYRVWETTWPSWTDLEAFKNYRT
ncbi:nuclear transport factor 2 family protein [Plantibacter sp. RU18]|uniref:nuclear transport factor 2 family protein n=1 Tax=Plantibacter sp. RU18 TaxID=3158143 RepID=UPI003D35F169